jgi:hypothetical protein
MWSCLYVVCLDYYIQQLALKCFQYRFDFSTVVSVQYPSSSNIANHDWCCASFLIVLVSVLHLSLYSYIYWNAHNLFCKCVWNILNRNTVLSLIVYILYRFYVGDTRWSFCLRRCAKAGRSQIQFPMVSLEISIDIILPAPLLPCYRLNL